MTVLLLVALPVVFWVGVYTYVEHAWRDLAPGMSRAQVDQRLSAFGSSPFDGYNAVGPGQFVIRYELLGMGKATMIQVIYNADGTVADAQPIFDI